MPKNSSAASTTILILSLLFIFLPYCHIYNFAYECYKALFVNQHYIFLNNTLDCTTSQGGADFPGWSFLRPDLWGTVSLWVGFPLMFWIDKFVLVYVLSLELTVFRASAYYTLLMILILCTSLAYLCTTHPAKAAICSKITAFKISIFIAFAILVLPSTFCTSLLPFALLSCMYECTTLLCSLTNQYGSQKTLCYQEQAVLISYFV